MPKQTFFVLLLLLAITITIPLFASSPLQTPPANTEQFKIPTLVFKGKILDLQKIGGYDELYVNNNRIHAKKIHILTTGKIPVKIIKSGTEYHYTIYCIHGFMTILPPLLAILLALILKDVIIPLFIGIFTGVLFMNDFNFLASFLHVIDRYILEAIADVERAAILLFTFLLGGMIGIITKCGGVKGLVTKLSHKVHSPYSVQFFTWLMGILIFFDDYANTLVVGNTMRPLSDKWNVSREKLAYVVDSTSSPITSIALISTWIGFEISLISQSLKAYNIGMDAYHVFIFSLPYRFYSILALILVFLTIILKRDLGPMLKAENRARSGKVIKDDGVPMTNFEASGLSPSRHVHGHWYNGLLPILMLIGTAVVGFYISGKLNLAAMGDPLANKSLLLILTSPESLIRDMGTIIASANSFQVMIWASFAGLLTAFLLAGSQRILKLRDILTAMMQGMKSMMTAVIILVLAWALGTVIVQLNTADYLVSLLSSSLNYHLLPALVFVLACVISVSTGTAWGTISIMYPLVIPMTVFLTTAAGDTEYFMILTISSVLAGAVFGDHCSPIADTTIMSSVATSCDHMDHMKTQIPYAILAAVIALFAGILPASFGFPYLACLSATIGITIGVLFLFGKKTTEDYEESTA